MEAEHTKTRSELVHKETAAKYTAAMGRMKQLEKKLKRTISKSKWVPYDCVATTTQLHHS
jgi:adenylate kinase family enzyme